MTSHGALGFPFLVQFRPEKIRSELTAVSFREGNDVYLEFLFTIYFYPGTLNNHFLMDVW